MTIRHLLCSLFLAHLLVFSACSADPAPPVVEPCDAPSFADSQEDVFTPQEDTNGSIPDGAVPDPGTFGAPCNGNVDCDSGYCIESAGGYVCTKPCDIDCPDGWDCKSVAGGTDIIFLCVPRVQKLCAPCISDTQCSDGVCLDLADGGRCAFTCKSTEDCPDGFGCAEDAAGKKDGMYCQPTTGACDCNLNVDGGQRSCSKENDLGTCYGLETCDPEVGWTDCNALEAVPETCDGVDNDCNLLVDDAIDEGETCEVVTEGVGSCDGTTVCLGPQGLVCQGPEPGPELCDFKDNDCDGDVDEDFITDGYYGSFDHCGGCNISCAIGFPNALTTSCKVEAGNAQCVVDACADGYVLYGKFQCIPDVVSICQPCTDAKDCLGIDAACTSLGDGEFCTTACDGGADCPLGFNCQDVGAEKSQCVPDSNSCSCDPGNVGVSKPCSDTFTPADPNQPSYTCTGQETCEADGWGSCILPDEECDLVDNDCDGEVDENFKNAEGVYGSVNHCGGCNISCLALGFANAEPNCEISGAIPQCTYTCSPPFVDVNGFANDGCECSPQGDDDLAGDDLDANCDGIDGDLDQGVFVAKNGSDAGAGGIDDPLLSIAAGLTKAAQDGKRDVYVATGVYNESVNLEDGVGLFGGYSSDFKSRNVVLFETAILGPDPSDESPGAVNGVNVGTGQGGAETVLSGFTVIGANAANVAGSNSYAVYIQDGGGALTISNNRIFGGAGGNGVPGNSGVDGADGVGGASGLSAKNLTTPGAGNRTCSANQESQGGVGGTLQCGDNTNVSGGSGGSALCPDYAAQPGLSQNGDNGQGPGAGSGGAAGWDSLIDTFATCGACYIPPDNNPYSGATGNLGNVGTTGGEGNGCSDADGTVANGHWRGGGGGNGVKGGHGGGGGGGGAGGGVDIDGPLCWLQTSGMDLGGAGGGGGSGACRGSGGKAGKAGGGSFGVFLTYTNAPAELPTFADNLVRRGSGGVGGSGGIGGAGGVGGAGGPGGASGEGTNNMFCAKSGGPGGSGGQGGHGAGGGGGCGGVSYGLYLWQSGGNLNADSYKNNNNYEIGGTAGSGGQGGASLGSSGTSGIGGFEATTNF
jgi:hypothetical protein